MVCPACVSSLTAVFQSFKDFLTVGEAGLPALLRLVLVALLVVVYARLLCAQFRVKRHQALPGLSIHLQVTFKACKLIAIRLAPQHCLILVQLLCVEIARLDRSHS